MQLNNTQDNTVIANNEKWFNFFVHLPKVSTIILAAICLILGIVFASIFDSIFILIIWGGGAIYCAINYVFLKLLFSYQILHIYYLKKLYLQSNTTAPAAKIPEELPEI